MTPSEQFVASLTKQTFLSFWSFPSPLGKSKNELCDLLSVCGNDILIFSVKEIAPKNTGNPKLDFERWHRKAVTQSCEQIHGAERFLKSQEFLILKDGVTKLKLPKHDRRRYFRIAVAFGRGEEFPLIQDNNDTYIHVFDEEALIVSLTELDTFSDFVSYLRAKEELAENAKLVLHSGEKHMLAFYLLNGRRFPDGKDFVFSLDDDLWDGMKTDQRYIDWKDSIRESYLWDELIESFLNDFSNGQLDGDNSREQVERIIRCMALENRFERSRISKSFREFIGVTAERKAVARILVSMREEGIVYVFLIGDSKKRKARVQELQLRTFIAKSLYTDKNIFVGIARDAYQKNKGCSYDLHYMNLPEWTDEWAAKALEFRETLGYFRNPQQQIIKGTED